MKSISPIVAAAGAVVVFAAGYAQGAASGTSNPFINPKFLASSGIAYVEGPDAEPPPWPTNLPAAREPARTAVTAASGGTVAPVASVAAANAAPQDTDRVVPQDHGDLLAMNIPSSALGPVSNPPPAPTAGTELSPTDQDAQKVRPRARRTAQKEVTFGTTRDGRPVTIIWEH